MERKHEYKSTLIWTGNRGSGTMDYRAYDRYFTIKIDGKEDIKGSSDPLFRGDKSLHSPEDMLLASVSSCHMLWYLHLCADNGIVVLEYIDEALGIMQEEKDGSGKFTQIVLRPNVVIAQGGDVDKAIQLHHESGKMCFIANSLKFPIVYEPKISISD